MHAFLVYNCKSDLFFPSPLHVARRTHIHTWHINEALMCKVSGYDRRTKEGKRASPPPHPSERKKEAERQRGEEPPESSGLWKERRKVCEREKDGGWVLRPLDRRNRSATDGKRRRRRRKVEEEERHSTVKACMRACVVVAYSRTVKSSTKKGRRNRLCKN